MQLSKNVFIDDEKIENVIGYQITYTNEIQCITIRYLVDDKERTLTCDLEAVKFES